MLTAYDTLDLILHELGASAYRELDPPFTAAGVEEAIRQAGPIPVLAAIADDEAEAAELHDWLRPHVGGVTVTPVDEGFLVVAYRPTLPQCPPRERPRRLPAWSAPDAQPVPGSTDADLSKRALKRWLERATAEERRQVPHVGSNADQQLGSWGLLALDGDVWRPTVAAMVLGGVRPEVFVAGCRLRGVVDGVPVELRGSVSTMLSGLGRHLERRHRALVVFVVRHALLHRDWSRDEAVKAELVRGRLTVSYPGRLGGKPPGNPLLRHLAAELGLDPGVQGLAKVDACLKRARLPESTLFEREGWVHFVADLERPRRSRQSAGAASSSEPPECEAVEMAPPSLPSLEPIWSTEGGPQSIRQPGPLAVARPSASARIAAPASLPTPASVPAVEQAPASSSSPVPALAPPSLLPRDPEARANAVLAVLARGRGTTREIAATMGCSRPVIGKVLTALVAEGRVSKVAASPRSPFQAYEIR